MTDQDLFTGSTLAWDAIKDDLDPDIREKFERQAKNGQLSEWYPVYAYMHDPYLTAVMLQHTRELKKSNRISL